MLLTAKHVWPKVVTTGGILVSWLIVQMLSTATTVAQLRRAQLVVLLVTIKEQHVKIAIQKELQSRLTLDQYTIKDEKGFLYRPTSSRYLIMEEPKVEQ